MAGTCSEGIWNNRERDGDLRWYLPGWSIWEDDDYTPDIYFYDKYSRYPNSDEKKKNWRDLYTKIDLYCDLCKERTTIEIEIAFLKKWDRTNRNTYTLETEDGWAFAKKEDRYLNVCPKCIEANLKRGATIEKRFNYEHRLTQILHPPIKTPGR